MRRVVGKRVAELSAAGFDALRAGRPLLVDVGTGDGKHALAQARARPDWLVVGLDASAEAMRAASVRAAAKPARGGVGNAIFVCAPIEQPPDGVLDADEVHVLMPWGSLLRGVVGSDPAVLRGLRALARCGADVLVTLNLHAWRPPVPAVGATPEPDPQTVLATPSWAQAGFALESAEYLDAEAIDRLATSWSRRLTSSRHEFDVLAVRGRAV